jgi:hypothetical protein
MDTVQELLTRPQNNNVPRSAGQKPCGRAWATSPDGIKGLRRRKKRRLRDGQCVRRCVRTGRSCTQVLFCSCVLRNWRKTTPASAPPVRKRGGRWKCASRMKGKFQVRFLEGRRRRSGNVSCAYSVTWLLNVAT